MLNAIEDLIFKALINSCINHDEFTSVYIVLREYNDMKEKNCGIYYIKTMEMYCVNCMKNNVNKKCGV